MIGSLIGIQKYVYDIFGPAVNLAARLVGLCETMQITLSEDTARSLENDFLISEPGQCEIKGFGALAVYSLDEEIRR